MHIRCFHFISFVICLLIVCGPGECYRLAQWKTSMTRWGWSVITSGRIDQWFTMVCFCICGTASADHSCQDGAVCLVATVTITACRWWCGREEWWEGTALYLLHEELNNTLVSLAQSHAVCPASWLK